MKEFNKNKPRGRKSGGSGKRPSGKSGKRSFGESGGRFSGKSGKRSFRGSDRQSGPPTMYQVNCDKCGEKCEVPFKPSGNKPVYCRNCFRKDENPDSKSESNQFKKELDQINKKLDKILRSLNSD